MQIKLHADKLAIYGPKTDGGLTLTFSIGEYEQEQVAQLLMIPQQTVLNLTVEVEDGTDQRRDSSA